MQSLHLLSEGSPSPLCGFFRGSCSLPLCLVRSYLLPPLPPAFFFFFFPFFLFCLRAAAPSFLLHQSASIHPVVVFWPCSTPSQRSVHSSMMDLRYGHFQAQYVFLRSSIAPTHHTIVFFSLPIFCRCLHHLLLVTTRLRMSSELLPARSSPTGLPPSRTLLEFLLGGFYFCHFC